MTSVILGKRIHDVHTVHCCAKHGCKYGADDCTVETGKAPADYVCESCQEEIERLAESDLKRDWRKPPAGFKWINDHGDASCYVKENAAGRMIAVLLIIDDEEISLDKE